jgi:uncharacterized protein YjbJ (UPF0337 family)
LHHLIHAFRQNQSLGEENMTTQEQMFGHWNQLKGKIKEQWGQLTDDELQEVEGQLDQLVGLIQQKTGEGRQHIEWLLNRFSEECGDAFTSASETAREYADQATEALRGAAGQVRERAREHYEDSQDMVRRRPAETVAVAFGTGLLVGVIVGLVVRSK